MSIEALITSLKESLDANTAAMEAHTEALKAGGNVGAADTKTTTTRTRTTKAKTEDADPDAKTYTTEQVKAIAVKVKDEKGSAKAKELIAKYSDGGLAKLKAPDYAAFVADCEKALAADDDQVDDDETL